MNKDGILIKNFNSKGGVISYYRIIKVDQLPNVNLRDAVKINDLLFIVYRKILGDQFYLLEFCNTGFRSSQIRELFKCKKKIISKSSFKYHNIKPFIKEYRGSNKINLVKLTTNEIVKLADFINRCSTSQIDSIIQKYYETEPNKSN